MYNIIDIIHSLSSHFPSLSIFSSLKYHQSSNAMISSIIHSLHLEFKSFHLSSHRIWKSLFIHYEYHSYHIDNKYNHIAINNQSIIFHITSFEYNIHSTIIFICWWIDYHSIHILEMYFCLPLSSITHLSFTIHFPHSIIIELNCEFHTPFIE